MIDIHSRSRAAGYVPEVLVDAKILVVGAGALGENLLQDLALSGIGHLAVVDPDHAEPHNATRSPFHASETEQGALGTAKATVAAARLPRLATADRLEVRARVAYIQEVGDAAIAWADVVCAAVDNPRARAFLAERCRLVGRPLVEAGFDGTKLTLAVFSPDPDDACYRCLNPELVGAFSCAAYAAQAAQAGITPAVQAGAAALAAFQAEQAITLAHLDRPAPLLNHRLFLDLQTGRSNVVGLSRSAGCPGIHHLHVDLPEVPLAGHPTSLNGLLAQLAGVVEDASVLLPGSIVVRAACVVCGNLVPVLAPEWRWLLDPRCRCCGGPFCDVSEADTAGSAGAYWIDATTAATFGHVGLDQLGAPPGTILHVADADGQLFRCQLPGTIDDVLPLTPPNSLASLASNVMQLLSALSQD